MAKQQVELHFYQISYPWHNDEDVQTFVSSQKIEEDEHRMLLSTRTALLDFPPQPTTLATTQHRIHHKKLAIQKLQADTFTEVSRLNDEIQELLCIGQSGEWK